MTLRDRIRSWLGVDERAITPAQLFNTGAWVELWPSASGQAVNPTTVMSAALGACVRLLADDISTLPVDVFVKSGPANIPVDPPRWMVTPSGRLTDTFVSYISDWVTSIGTDGNAFTLCLPSVFDVRYVEVLDPSTVDVYDEDGLVRFRVAGAEKDETQVLHVPWLRLPGTLRGISPVQASKDSVGLELAAQKWASAFFRNGGTLGGIIEAPGGPETLDADKLREQFEARHKGEANWWKPAVLTGGAKFNGMNIKPQEAELAPLWQHVLEEAARIYHIPPHLLASQAAGGASYASIEERGIAYVRHATRPFTTRFERAHSLLLPGEQFAKLNLNALLRGDAKTRAEYYNQLLSGKVMRREEVRDKEDLPYDGELGYLETPNNNGPRESTGAAPPERALSIDTVTIADDSAQRIADTAAAGAAVAAAEVRASEDRLVAMFEGRIRAMEEERRLEREELAVIKSLLEVRHQAPDIRIDGDFVYYQRGAEVERKRVTRDETGRVIGMVAA